VIGTPAPELIATLARASPASLTLVTLGPLTNAALALRHDEEGFRQLAQVVVMGGAVNVPGNVTPDAEFNVYADPLAAREVLASGVPLVLVGLDVTTKVQLTREAASILAEDSFLHCVCEQLFAFNRSRGRPEQFSLHDPLAIGIALDPSLARTEPMKLGVTTSGRTERTAAGPVVEAALHVDSARFLELFYARVLAPAARG
jgi:purine nucleosidase